jgi:hypothetical protein
MKDGNVVCCLQVLQLVCDQKSSFALQEVTDAVVKQVAPHLGIYCRQRVIKYIYLGLLVNSPVNKNTTKWCIVLSVILRSVTYRDRLPHPEVAHK